MPERGPHSLPGIPERSDGRKNHVLHSFTTEKFKTAASRSSLARRAVAQID